MPPETNLYHWFPLGILKLHHLWWTRFHQTQALTSLWIYNGDLGCSINNTWNSGAINPNKYQHGIPTRILKHELSDRVTKSRFQLRPGLLGKRYAVIMCTYQTVHWSVPLSKRGEPLLRLRAVWSKMSWLPTVVTGVPTWWWWPAAISWWYCRTMIHQKPQRNASWPMTPVHPTTHHIIHCVRILFRCCIGHCQILTTLQKALHGDGLNYPIRNVWLCLRCLDQITIRKVLQRFCLLLLDWS